MKIVGIIPARYNSKRLPGKPLIKINGKTLIHLTYKSVLNSRLFDSIYIATDSIKIRSAVKKFGAQCIMTSSDNQNGTERCVEVINKLKHLISDKDIIINIQCDEPFIKKEHFIKIINLFKNKIQIGTLVSPIQKDDLLDESVVKVNLKTNKTAIDFSRSISHLNNEQKIYKHIGIYAYQKNTLIKLSRLKATEQELNKNLEQLRWIEHGYKIVCAVINKNLISINTKNDIKKL